MRKKREKKRKERVTWREELHEMISKEVSSISVEKVITDGMESHIWRKVKCHHKIKVKKLPFNQGSSIKYENIKRNVIAWR